MRLSQLYPKLRAMQERKKKPKSLIPAQLKWLGINLLLEKPMTIFVLIKYRVPVI